MGYFLNSSGQKLYYLMQDFVLRLILLILSNKQPLKFFFFCNIFNKLVEKAKIWLDAFRLTLGVSWLPWTPSSGYPIYMLKVWWNSTKELHLGSCPLILLLLLILLTGKIWVFRLAVKILTYYIIFNIVLLNAGRWLTRG